MAIFPQKKIMVAICLVLSIFSASLFSIEIDPSSVQQNEEEALFLRRIIDFWDEGQRLVVKQELEKYLQENTSSNFTDYLNALLGDIYLCEDNLASAVEKYANISNLDIKEKILPNYIQSLYHLKRFGSVCQECIANEEIIKACDKDTYHRFCFILGDSYYNQALDATDEEMKKAFANNAKAYFAKLIDQPFEKDVLEQLANVEAILQEYEIAAGIYVKLSDKNPSRREEFLFHAANMQLAYDKNMALQTFTQISHIGKEKKLEAAFNRLLILIDQEKWSEIVLAKDQFSELLKGDQKLLFTFYLAKSYYVLQNFSKAADVALSYLDKATEFTGYTKAILQMMTSLGEKMENQPLFDKAIVKFEEFAPNDIDLAKIYLARAVYFKKKGDYQKAKLDFASIEKKFIDFEDESYLVESAHFYYQMKDYLRSRLRFKSYIGKTQNKELLPVCLNYFINSSIKITESIPDDKKEAAKSVLLKDLEEYLTNEAILPTNDVIERTVLLGQLKYELSDPEDALKTLMALYDKYEIVHHRPEVTLLIADSYKKIDENLLFCFYGEKTIENDLDHSLDLTNLRLGLFNEYISRYSSAKKMEFLDKAAENLYMALSFNPSLFDGKTGVKTENILWLASHYYNKVEEYMKVDWRRSLSDDKEINICATRAILSLEQLINSSCPNFEISKENLFLEQEVLRLADLYGYKKDYSAKKEVLENLVKNYRNDDFFQNKDKAYFNLALTYQILGDTIQAKNFFSKVIALNSKNYFNVASNLNFARLELSSIDEPNFKLDNPKVVEELSCLKNIKLQKNLQNEPLHLEAALDYVDVQSKIENSLDSKIALLLKIKQDFTQGGDIISLDYQNSMKLYPDKVKIVDAYLTLVDAKILLLNAEKEHNIETLAQAESLIKRLKDDGLILTSYLDKKIEEISQEIKMLKERHAKVE